MIIALRRCLSQLLGVDIWRRRIRAELKFEESENDAIISVLCPGENAGDCAGRPDEQEMVQYYLTRRFNIKG